MRVLVVIDATHGCGHADGSGPLDGELATPLTVRRTGHDGRGGARETDHVLGIESGHLASAARVVDIDVPREVIVDSIHEALLRRGPWVEVEVAAVADALAAGMLDVAARFPVGTVLTRRRDGTRLEPTPPPPPAPRRRGCTRPPRGGG